VRLKPLHQISIVGQSGLSLPLAVTATHVMHQGMSLELLQLLAIALVIPLELNDRIATKLF
jgi:hypothetical protein